jgi:hypothetical protein
VFVVSAHTADPGVYWVSEADSGWSVDNLPPAVPTDLILTDSLLSWAECPDPDFHHFSVYGSQTGDFGDAEWIDDTVPPVIVVHGLGYAWYHVTASDSAGNESEDASAEAGQVSVDDLPAGKAAYFLASASPNPFTTTTSIAFGLAVEGRASVVVYDIEGRVVARLLDEHLPPGRHGVIWDRRTASGARAAPGVYVVMFESGTFSARAKMVCLQ